MMVVVVVGSFCQGLYYTFDILLTIITQIGTPNEPSLDMPCDGFNNRILDVAQLRFQ